MLVMERLALRHAVALLRFEQENRDYFASSVPDRGDDYFALFARRHAALLEEQAAGHCHFHVLVADDGAIVGRFNLVDVTDGSAELGFRVAERVAGQGVAKGGVRQICEYARDDYGLHRLFASAALDNAGSLAVLRATGFVPVGPARLDGRAGLLHRRELM